MSFLSKFFKKEKKKRDISIHEDISGNYHYHIAIDNIPLCGKKNTMRREMALSSWGIKSPHIGERYCAECERRWFEEKE
jgi:hypothetical protein